MSHRGHAASSPHTKHPVAPARVPQRLGRMKEDPLVTRQRCGIAPPSTVGGMDAHGCARVLTGAHRRSLARLHLPCRGLPDTDTHARLRHSSDTPQAPLRHPSGAPQAATACCRRVQCDAARTDYDHLPPAPTLQPLHLSNPTPLPHCCTAQAASHLVRPCSSGACSVFASGSRLPAPSHATLPLSLRPSISISLCDLFCFPTNHFPPISIDLEHPTRKSAIHARPSGPCLTTPPLLQLRRYDAVTAPFRSSGCNSREQCRRLRPLGGVDR